MPSKPDKFGYKSQALSDAHNGYLLNIIPYSKNNYPDSDLMFTDAVIYDLVSNYSNQGYNLFMDSYYTNALLFENLYMIGFNCCGSLGLKQLHSQDNKTIKKTFAKI